MTSQTIPTTNNFNEGHKYIIRYHCINPSMFFGLQIEEQYRDVRYLNNCKDIKANGIKTDDPIAWLA